MDDRHAVAGSIEVGIGLADQFSDPLRYDGQSDDPYESSALIVSAIPAGSRVLDVGCGTGSVSVRVRDKCPAEIIGIEPSEDRARLAMSRGVKVYNTLFPSGELLPDASFDVVLFADVLEHLVDPATALREARSYLRAGGCIVASIPNVAHWSVRWELLFGKFQYQPYGIMDATHLRWFTRESVFNLFGLAGFKIERYTTSAGTEQQVYHTKFPWRRIGPRTRDSLIIRMNRLFPTMFGCQHIVTARMV